MLGDASERGIALVTIADEQYPSQLLHLHDPPPVLWSRGDWTALRDPVVAVVGHAASDQLRPARDAGDGDWRCLAAAHRS